MPGSSDARGEARTVPRGGVLRFILSRHKRIQFEYLFWVVLATLANVALIQAGRAIIDQGLVAGDPHRLLALCGWFGAAALVGVLAVSTREITAARVQARFISGLRDAICDRLLRVSPEVVVSRGVGELHNRVMHDVSRLGQSIEWIVARPVVSVTSVVFFSAYLFRMSPVLCAVALLTVPISILPVPFLNRALSRQRSATMRAQVAYAGKLNETLAAIPEIQLHQAFGYESAKLAEAQLQVTGSWQREMSLLAILSSTADFARSLGALAIYVVGGLMVIHGKVSLGTLVAVLAAAASVYAAIRDVINYVPLYRNASDRFADLQTVLQTALAIAPAGGPTAPGSGPLHLELRGVSVELGTGRTVLEDVDLRIAPGEHLGLVGPTGCGKSTLLNLFAGVVRPTRGGVFVAGRPLGAPVDQQALAPVGYVGQRPLLFHETLRYNLLYAARCSDAAAGPGEIDDPAVLEVCEGIGLGRDLLLLGLHTPLGPQPPPFVPALCSRLGVDPSRVASRLSSGSGLAQALRGSDADVALSSAELEVLAVACREVGCDRELQLRGLDFNVGEGGARLSGGQKQKVAVARVLLRGCPILLLDEVYANLDPESAERLSRWLRSARPGTTTITISHQHEFLRGVDRIVELAGGKIVCDDDFQAWWELRAVSRAGVGT